MSGCWVVLAVLGHSLEELSSTLGVRLKNRRPLFTGKNWAADLKKKKKKTCKVTSANGVVRKSVYDQRRFTSAV